MTWLLWNLIATYPLWEPVLQRLWWLTGFHDAALGLLREVGLQPAPCGGGDG